MDITSIVALLILSSVSLGSTEQAGRIDTQSNSGFRCAAQSKLPESQCRDMQIEAEERGCITAEELRFLSTYQLCPVCDWDEEGLDAYMGYCHGYREQPREPRKKEYRKIFEKPRRGCPHCRVP